MGNSNGKYKELPKRTEVGELLDETFSVVSYNVLADCYIGETDYPYCPSWARAQATRHSQLMVEFKHLDADVLCLQEVEPVYYESLLKPSLESAGYSGHHVKKCNEVPDGIAIFFRLDRFTLREARPIMLNELANEVCVAASVSAERSRVLCDSVALALVLECKITKCLVVIANTHLFWNWRQPDTQALQCALLTQYLHNFSDSLAPPRPVMRRPFPWSDAKEPAPPPEMKAAIASPVKIRTGGERSVREPSRLPYVLCGDFNALPTSAPYVLLHEGTLRDEDKDSMRKVNPLFTGKGDNQVPSYLIDMLSSCFYNPTDDLASAYETVVGGEPEFTNRTGQFTGCLDYIWFTATSLEAASVLAAPDLVATEKGLPNHRFPSDHVSLRAHFRFRQDETPPRPTLSTAVENDLRSMLAATLPPPPPGKDKDRPRAGTGQSGGRPRGGTDGACQLVGRKEPGAEHREMLRRKYRDQRTSRSHDPIDMRTAHLKEQEKSLSMSLSELDRKLAEFM